MVEYTPPITRDLLALAELSFELDDVVLILRHFTGRETVLSSNGAIDHDLPLDRSAVANNQAEPYTSIDSNVGDDRGIHNYPLIRVSSDLINHDQLSHKQDKSLAPDKAPQQGSSCDLLPSALSTTKSLKRKSDKITGHIVSESPRKLRQTKLLFDKKDRAQSGQIPFIPR